MIFKKSIIIELLTTGSITIVSLFAITISTQFIRFLGYAAQGQISSDAVLVILGFASIKYLPILLSFSVFLSILIVMTRTYRDSEMIVWLSSGYSLINWLKPISGFVIPIIFLIMILSNFISPWAVNESEIYKKKYEDREEISAISPGVFKESKNGEKVFFIEKFDVDLSVVANIFIFSNNDLEETVTVAQKGHQESEQNSNILILDKGRRYSTDKNENATQIVEFEKYTLKLNKKKEAPYIKTSKGLNSYDLYKTRNNNSSAELFYRLSLLISTVILSILAVAISNVDLKKGRSFNIIIAVLIFMIYNNLISICQTWVIKGNLNVVQAFFASHLFIFLLTIFLFLYRNNPFFLKRKNFK